MGAENPIRRTLTAREVAARMGCSIRSVQRIVAEPRDEFLARSTERQLKAAEMKDQGKTYREIAETLECTPKAAENLVLRGRKAKLKQDS